MPAGEPNCFKTDNKQKMQQPNNSVEWHLAENRSRFNLSE
jgi:hypothetical protein